MNAARAQRAERARRLNELEARSHQENARDWHLLFREDFSAPEAFKERWLVVGGANTTWELVDGGIRVRRGGGEFRLKLNDPVLLARLTDDVRVDFICRQVGESVNDVSCFFGGYDFQYGGQGNQFNLLHGPGDREIYREAASPLTRGGEYHACAEKIGNTLRYSVNGETVFDAADDSASGRGVKQVELYYILGIPRSFGVTLRYTSWARR